VRLHRWGERIEMGAECADGDGSCVQAGSSGVRVGDGWDTEKGFLYTKKSAT
jgi:hypothetical protein